VAQLADHLGELGRGDVASSDVDFQGTRGLLLRAAELLGATARIPRFDHASPMVGLVAFLDSDGHQRQLDFLPELHGLRAGDVANSAVRILIAHPDGHEIPLWVMHPQRCLERRIHNTSLPGRNTRLAWAQLRAAIRCTKAFSQTLLDSAGDDATLAQSRRVVLNLNERTFRFARQNLHAREVAVAQQIECFDAVLVDERLGDEFVARRYPQMQKRITDRREGDRGRAWVARRPRPTASFGPSHQSLGSRSGALATHPAAAVAIAITRKGRVARRGSAVALLPSTQRGRRRRGLIPAGNRAELAGRGA
jgi:hypothetical protein